MQERKLFAPRTSKRPRRRIIFGNRRLILSAILTINCGIVLRLVVAIFVVGETDGKAKRVSNKMELSREQLLLPQVGYTAALAIPKGQPLLIAEALLSKVSVACRRALALAVLAIL